MKTYRIDLSEAGGGDHEIDCGANRPSREACEGAAAAWLTKGDWGTEGARVSADWELVEIDDEAGDGEYAAEEVIEEGSETVDIEPDHGVLIERATKRDDKGRCCGLELPDHVWTRQGEGGCGQNPGVWSEGGTTLVYHSHCRVCGLHMRTRRTGPQHNPGECDTAEYTWPARWCADCEAESCDCEQNFEQDDEE